MPNVDQIYPSKYLKVADLRGIHRTVTIERTFIENMTDSATRESKPMIMLKFVNVAKVFGLNVTMAKQCKEWFGSADSDQWVGQPLVLFPTQVQAFDKIVDAIRIRTVQMQAIMDNQRAQAGQAGDAFGGPAPVPTQQPALPPRGPSNTPDPNYVQTTVNTMARDFAPPDTAVRGNQEADWGGDDEDDPSIPF